MKILYVSTWDHIIPVLVPHMEGAKRAGYRIEVACRVTRNREVITRIADALHEVPLSRFPLHPSNFVALAQLTELIRREKYDIVHCHNPSGGFFGRLAATNAGVGSLRVYTPHGFHFHRHGNPLSNVVFEAVERYAGHNLSDAVYVINKEDYQAALTQNVVPQERLFATRGVGLSTDEQYNPVTVSAEERQAFRGEMGATPETPILSLIGEMLPRKRQFDAIQAMVKIVTTYPETLLLLVGDGKMLAQNQELAKSLGVSQNCRFLGFRRDVKRILASSDIFVFPSGQEGLPRVIQEALAMEVPTIATDVRGNCELVSEENGRLVPLASPERLADAVIELLSLSPSERQEMGKRGRTKMVAEYARDQCVADWLNLYTVASERRNARVAA